MKAVNIEWDVTDDAEDMTQEEMNEVLETLPTEIELPDEIAIDEDGEIDYDGIDDYLSDETGFCHNGYVLED